MGHIGVIHEGDAQWMTAGSGVIHSEMPAEAGGQRKRHRAGAGGMPLVCARLTPALVFPGCSSLRWRVQ